MCTLHTFGTSGRIPVGIPDGFPSRSLLLVSLCKLQVTFHSGQPWFPAWLVPKTEPFMFAIRVQPCHRSSASRWMGCTPKREHRGGAGKLFPFVLSGVRPSWSTVTSYDNFVLNSKYAKLNNHWTAHKNLMWWAACRADVTWINVPAKWSIGSRHTAPLSIVSESTPFWCSGHPRAGAALPAVQVNWGTCSSSQYWCFQMCPITEHSLAPALALTSGWLRVLDTCQHE